MDSVRIIAADAAPVNEVHERECTITFGPPTRLRVPTCVVWSTAAERSGDSTLAVAAKHDRALHIAESV